ncbi:MarR family EPS-associated transcriptional regulator [Celeribacter indicus]|uniref:MarR family transcriptional regulator n=1 Tax=Celeribacter indicus TaxID=1208324 RepID=A0A0B5E0J8_9RHOB|nr:MarR family EPS-associated transcriptional regulator [Celeribacter indicus]AJE48779.1 MarR family transcriptional regulator [Celeribacter indicus]SDX10777.1 EPS-associated transcriptional regulator, MarR family [Celeribacter indicus]
MTESRRKTIQEDIRFRILREIEQNPEISQRELSRALGTSLGRIHYLLHALIEKGLIKAGNFSAAENKASYRYLLTARGVTEKARLTRRFLARKMEEYEALTAEIARVQRELDGSVEGCRSGRDEG